MLDREIDILISN